MCLLQKIVGVDPSRLTFKKRGWGGSRRKTRLATARKRGELGKPENCGRKFGAHEGLKLV